MSQPEQRAAGQVVELGESAYLLYYARRVGGPDRAVSVEVRSPVQSDDEQTAAGGD